MWHCSRASVFCPQHDFFCDQDMTGELKSRKTSPKKRICLWARYFARVHRICTDEHVSRSRPVFFSSCPLVRGHQISSNILRHSNKKTSNRTGKKIRREKVDKTFLTRQDAYQQTDSNCPSEVPKKLMWDGVGVSFEGSDVNRKWISRVPRGLQK